MVSVVPLRYGTAFKKAFSDPVAFSALVQAALGIEFTSDHIEQQFSYREPVARVNIAYDLFAEDKAHRIIVELQHVRDDESYDRFLYYHCIGIAEQIVSSDSYHIGRDVYTLVLLTRWPDDERLRFGRAISDPDPVTEEGANLNVYRHRLVFVNARAPLSMLPPALHPLAKLVEDTLDGEVDETQYHDEVSRRILARIGRGSLSADENARLKEEATWENAKRESKADGLREGKADGLREGKADGLREGLRAAVELACDLLGIELTNERQAELAGLDLAGLEALQRHLRSQKQWPTKEGSLGPGE